MSDMLEATFDHSSLDSCFIGLPEGVFLIADDRAGDKFDEDGSLKSISVTQRPWYTGAVEKKGLYFTDVETDAFNGQIGIVCALPVYHDGKLAAVVGADLFLDSLQEAVDASDQYGGFICIVNEQGHVIFSPKKEGLFQVRLSSESEDLRESGGEDLAAFVNDSMKNRLLSGLLRRKASNTICPAPLCLQSAGPSSVLSVKKRRTSPQP